MKQDLIYLFYKKNGSKKELTYIGTDFEDGIAQICAYKNCSKHEEKELMLKMNSENWIVETQFTNCFVE